MIVLITVFVAMLPFVLRYFRDSFIVQINKCKKSAMTRFLLFLLSKDSIDTMTNLSITIVGVTLALLLTNADVDKQNTSKTIELLNSLDRELKMVQDNCEKAYIPIFSILDESEDIQECVNYYRDVPLGDFLTLDSILESELVTVGTNQYSYAAMLDIRRALIATYNRLACASTDEELIRELNTLSKDIALMRTVIACEISFQEGKTRTNKMRDSINKLYEDRWATPTPAPFAAP